MKYTIGQLGIACRQFGRITTLFTNAYEFTSSTGAVFTVREQEFFTAKELQL